MASSPATAPPPDSTSPSMNTTSPPSPEDSTPPPPASAPPPSSPPPSSPPPSSPPPTPPLPSSPPPLHFPPPPPASSPPLPASSPPPPNSTPPPPQYSSPPPPDSPQFSSPPPPAPSSPAPIFFSPPPLSPNGSPPPSPALPPPLPTSPTPPQTSKGSPPPPTTMLPPSPLSPTPPSSFEPPPSSDDFLPPPPPKRAAEAPPHSSPPTNDYNVDSKKSSGGSHVNLPMVAGIAAGIALFFLIIGVVACVCCRKKKKKVEKKKMPRYPDPGLKGNNYYNIGSAPPKWNNGGQEAVGKLPPPPGMAWNPPHSPADINTDNGVGYSEPNGPPLGFVKSAFSYEELAAATNGFSEENILGQGGFGYVHKGILPNGQEVAVKQLKAGSGQGEREFQAEVEIISRVHHRHLVSLVGYCIVGSQRLLVYEFVPNKTLEFHLHGKDQPTMDWPTRMRIALGSAKGLAYLHEDCHPRIIHRDIKASNILLDYRFEAKVADFGLAKLSSDNYTHVSTRVMGTFGYLAPEYAASGKLSEKSDVFSFGVMLLELITGKRPVHSNPMVDSLVDWARPLLTQELTDENYEKLVDPRLEGNYIKMEMARMVACAATSVRHSAKLRPKMSQIVRALEGDSSLEDLTEGVKPGQSMQFTSSSEHESGSYASHMKRLRTVFNSKDLSQDYSGTTSDYGLNPLSSSSFEEISTVMAHPDRAGVLHKN